MKDVLFKIQNSQFTRNSHEIHTKFQKVHKPCKINDDGSDTDDTLINNMLRLDHEHEISVHSDYYHTEHPTVILQNQTQIKQKIQIIYQIFSKTTTLQISYIKTPHLSFARRKKAIWKKPLFMENPKTNTIFFNLQSPKK